MKEVTIQVNYVDGGAKSVTKTYKVIKADTSKQQKISGDVTNHRFLVPQINLHTPKKRLLRSTTVSSY